MKIWRQKKSGQPLSWFIYPACICCMFVWSSLGAKCNKHRARSCVCLCIFIQRSLPLWLSKAAKWSANLERATTEENRRFCSACSSPNHTDSEKIPVTISQTPDFSLETNLHSTANSTLLNWQSHLAQHAEWKQKPKDRRKGPSGLK